MTQFDSKLIAQAKKTKGYLLKKSKSIFSNWKKRYFIVLQDSLCIFEDQTLQLRSKSIHFSQIMDIQPFDNFQIQIKTKKKLVFLKAENTADQDLWVASLNILRQNYLQNIKNPKKIHSSSKSRQKPLILSKHSSQLTIDKTKANSSSKKDFILQKVTYLLREKQLSKFLSILNLDKLSNVTKEPKFLSRILFVEDKKKGFYFSLSSKSIYPIIDGQLVKQDFIYPYQLNVLYFMSLDTYKNAIQKKAKFPQMFEICKSSEILESTIVNSSIIKLQIHCQKPIQIQVNHISQMYVNNLLQCIKQLIQVGLQYWNPKGKLMRNIDKFLEKFEQSEQNELVFYQMTENQFQAALNIKIQFDKKQIQTFFNKVDSLIFNLRAFIDACQIKSPPANQIKQKFVKLYHKFVYNFLSQNWNFIYKQASDEQLIVYSKKVFMYYQTIDHIHHDGRVKQGCKTLLKITLKNFQNTINQLVNNFSNVEEQYLRILKVVDIQTKQNETFSESIFFSTFCTNFFSILSIQFKSLGEIPKNQQFVIISWISMRHIFKIALQSLSMIAESCKQRSSLISISNSLTFLKNKKIPQLFQELEKSILCSYKKQKEEFFKEINYEITQVETFCVKKLFIITFSSIDKDLLKHEIQYMDFQKICSIVIQEIFKLEFILPEVKVHMYEAAFEEVCYFFYICVVKFENKNLAKDECLSMINQKMMIIKESFTSKVDQQKIMLFLKDLNLLKQFITCPINNIKTITRDIKKVFGSNFTQMNLKNLISLRVNTLKQKQSLFQECRQEIKSSYNSADEMESFQRQSFFNSSYRRQRKSTLTQSIQSYHQNLQNGDKKHKTQKIMLFGFSNSIKQSYLYRKRVFTNFNTSYARFYYRLVKGKLYQFDNQNQEDCLNCYLLSQLKKCYIEPQMNDRIHLQFQKQTLKLKSLTFQQASQWIQKILDAMEEQKIGELNQSQEDQGVLFEDLSKKITFETKQTNQVSSPNEKQKNKTRKIISPDLKNSRAIKNSQKIPSNIHKKSSSSPLKLNKNSKEKQTNTNIRAGQSKAKKTSRKGCGTGCNFF